MSESCLSSVLFCAPAEVGGSIIERDFQHGVSRSCTPLISLVGLWAAYKNQRIILWDTTNIPIPQPGDAEGQSLTWNSYYHQNCGKAGIGVQPCGWIRCAELWMGAASDTLYHSKNEGILPMQQEFQESDKIDETIIPFIQILDRGYQVQKASLDAGKQKVEQPFFADKEGFFSTSQVQRSAAVASERSGNERAVRICKLPGYIQRGPHSRSEMDRFCNVWLAWTFQVNFMFAPIH
jgi:hypothetical protein